TLTELGYLSGVGSAIQTQINGLLPLAGGTMSGVLNMGGKRVASVGAPTTTSDAIPYDTANTVTTNALVASAVTQIQRSTTSIGYSQASTTAITTVTLTTTGGPVLVVASTSLNLNASTNARILLFRDSGTSLNTAEISLSSAVSGAQGMGLSYLDTPTAGSHTYRLNYILGNGSVSSVGEY